jgi:hypothetical protein
MQGTSRVPPSPGLSRYLQPMSLRAAPLRMLPIWSVSRSIQRQKVVRVAIRTGQNRFRQRGWVIPPPPVGQRRPDGDATQAGCTKPCLAHPRGNMKGTQAGQCTSTRGSRLPLDRSDLRDFVSALNRGCPRRPGPKLHGKEGVDGSSPSEGTRERPRPNAELAMSRDARLRLSCAHCNEG